MATKLLKKDDSSFDDLSDLMKQVENTQQEHEDKIVILFKELEHFVSISHDYYLRSRDKQAELQKHIEALGF